MHGRDRGELTLVSRAERRFTFALRSHCVTTVWWL